MYWIYQDSDLATAMRWWSLFFYILEYIYVQYVCIYPYMRTMRVFKLHDNKTEKVLWLRSSRKHKQETSILQSF